MVRSDLCEPGVFSSTYKYKQNIENKRGHLDNQLWFCKRSIVNMFAKRYVFVYLKPILFGWSFSFKSRQSKKEQDFERVIATGPYFNPF